MNKKLKILYLLCISLISIFIFPNCDHRNKQEITVYYFYGNIEACIPIECTELDSLCKLYEYDDTIFIDSAMADQITNAITRAKSINAAAKADSIKEGSILSPLIYVHTENSDLCLNQRDNMCWVKDDNNKYNLSILSDSVSYLLRWKSMFYDYLPLDDLDSFKGIQQYGIPADYIHRDMWPKETIKVLLKVK